MIGLPVNDETCLGAITEQIAAQVKDGDPVLVELAERHGTTEQLAAWIRSLPQRDDDGVPGDGPKVAACAPPQRVRVPADDPNCVERAAIYIAVAELIDPNPTRQLATTNTPYGLHTFPVEQGAPIILDPRVHRNSLGYGLAFATPGPVSVASREAIEWSAQLAIDGAGVMTIRNGASRVARGRNAMIGLVDHGIAPAPSEVEEMGWMFAVAEQTARRFGRRAVRLVRTVASAISEMVDEMLVRYERESLRNANESALAQGAATVGVSAGLNAIVPGLGAFGPTLLGAVEGELSREGLNLGPFVPPAPSTPPPTTPPPSTPTATTPPTMTPRNRLSGPPRNCGCSRAASPPNHS